MTTEPIGLAERKYRDAFERLKHGKPVLLEKGSAVSQNNVAREAGVDPSAIRPARFPALVRDIQKWIKEHNNADSQPSPRQRILAIQTLNRSLRERIAALEEQRDDALGRLAHAEAKLLELFLENDRLNALFPQTNATLLRR